MSLPANTTFYDVAVKICLNAVSRLRRAASTFPCSPGTNGAEDPSRRAEHAERLSRLGSRTFRLGTSPSGDLFSHGAPPRWTQSSGPFPAAFLRPGCSG